ncbi:MAG: hypothetical protein QM755_05325 [Luteolibacter sp.]
MLSFVTRISLGLMTVGIVSCAPKEVQSQVQNHSPGPSMQDHPHVTVMPVSPERNRRIAREIQSLIRRKVVKPDDVIRPNLLSGSWPGLAEISDDKGELVVINAGKRRYILKIEPFGPPYGGERLALMRRDEWGFHDDQLFDGFSKGQVVVRRVVIWDWR